MSGAEHRLEVVVHEPAAPRQTLGRTLLGPLARHPPRFVVVVLDTDAGGVLMRVPVNESRRDAEALAAVFRHDIGVLDERAFLKKHGRWARPR